jgi:uncharacterized membrane protein HdeD (DUF308 family)
MTMLTGVPDAAAVQGRWKWLVVMGVVFAILGVLALGNAVQATLITTQVIGVLLMIAAVFQLVAAFTGARSVGMRLLSILLAILYVVVGYDLLADPIQGAITLTLVLAIFLFAGGIVRIATSVMTRGEHWVWVFAIGIIDVLLGFWLWTGIPFTGIAIGIFVGLELLMAGILWIVIGFSLRGGGQPTSQPAAA